MTDEDYEILPKNTVSNLKKQVDDLRGTPMNNRNLQSSMDNLSKSINNMIDMFRVASEEIKLEEKEDELVSNKIDPLLAKLDAIIDQNKKIAQGMVAIADIVKEQRENSSPSAQKSASEPMGISKRAPSPMSPPPSMSRTPPMPPPPSFARPNFSGSMGPMPPTGGPIVPPPSFGDFGEDDHLPPSDFDMDFDKMDRMSSAGGPLMPPPGAPSFMPPGAPPFMPPGSMPEKKKGGLLSGLFKK